MAPAPPLHDPANLCPAAFDATYKERLIVLGGFIGLIIAGFVLGLVFAPEETRLLLGLMAASFFFLGKFLPLVALEDPTFGFYDLGAVIWVMDTMTVLLLVYSLEGLYRWGFAARVLRRVQDKATLVIDAFPKIRRYAFVGMVLFVLFPVSGTGAIGGTFLGILLGLHRLRVIAAVCLGGFIGGMGMAFLAERFGTALEALKDNPWLIAGLIAVIVAALVGLNLAYKRALKRSQSPEPPDDSTGPGGQ